MILTYQQIIEAHRAGDIVIDSPQNSPKSDINPALRAGLGAVLVPHPRTWSLEHEDVPEPSERFQVVERFSDLKELF